MRKSNNANITFENVQTIIATAVASSDNGKQEDSTQKPLVHVVYPGWGSEDEDLMNTTKEDVPSGVIPAWESKHEKETSHTGTCNSINLCFQVLLL